MVGLRDFCFSKMIGVLVSATIISEAMSARADTPDATSARFGGFYKVTSSTDPTIPAAGEREYFFDFGRGIQAGKLSGSVAISVRHNPHVQIRMFAWQYFPESGKMVIGNPYAEGSRKAVALGAWQMKGLADGVLFERGGYQIVLQRAAKGD